MKTKMITVLVFLIVGLTFGQNALPTEGLKHHFKFDDSANLEKALIGNNLQRDALSGVTQLFNSVDGPAAGNKAVEVGLGSFYRLDLDFEPNGSDTAKRVNQFSLVIDFYLPITGVWYAFHAATNDGNPTESDWESFVRDNGAVGVGTTGYSRYKVPAMEWHRLVISADIGKSYKYYLDGQLTQDGGAQVFDGRFSLPSIDGANQILLFGDNDGEDANIYIAELGVYDRALSSKEIFELSGYGHSIPLEVPYGLWTFDDADDLTKPFYGNNLELVGSHSAVSGPEEIDGAVSLGVGSHYIVKHDMASTAGERVNQYTMLVDFKIGNLGTWYSILQTDATNTTDAELFINQSGKIGVGDLGYTDTSVVAGDWYRLAVTVDLGNAVKFYLDGDSVHFGGAQEIDNRFSLDPRSLGNKLLLFADNDGEDGALDVAKVTFYNRVLTSEDVKGLGGFEHGPLNTEVTGAGKAVYFNGNDVNNKYGIVNKTNEDFNFGDGNFTIEVWVKPDLKYDSDPSILSDKDWGSGGNPGWVISIRGDDWKFNAADENRNRYDVNGPNISDGNWHHLAVIAKQDSGLKLITDNLETVWAGGDDFFKVGNINSILPLCIAQDGTQKYSDAPPAPAQIDEIRIWKGVAVDPKVVFEWRNKKLDATHPNWNSLVAYWVFNEGEGTSVADLSGRNNNVQLIGSPRWEISYAALGNSSVQALNNVNAIWGGSKESTSGGVTLSGSFPFPAAFSNSMITEKTFGVVVKEDNPFIVFGHNGLSNATTAGLSGIAAARLSRSWYLDKTETPVSDLSVTFDISELGGTGNAGEAAGYVLLTSQDENGAFNEVSSTVTTSDDQITFSGVVVNEGYITLASKNLSNSPLGGLIVGVEDENNVLPKDFNISQNYPNPFNPATKIDFSLPVTSYVELTVYNVLGQVVDVLVNKNLSAGNHSINWNAERFTSGLYIYKMKASGANGKEFIKVHKMMLLK